MRSSQAQEFGDSISPLLLALKRAGKSLRQIADELNSQGHTTRRGKQWNPTQVIEGVEADPLNQTLCSSGVVVFISLLLS